MKRLAEEQGVSLALFRKIKKQNGINSIKLGYGSFQNSYWFSNEIDKENMKQEIENEMKSQSDTIP